MLKPKRLQKHSVIGVVAPSSPIKDYHAFQQSVLYLEKLGYRVKIAKSVYAKEGYLAGSDKKRLDDIHSMFADKRVEAILCARGGYGSTRLLSHLDFSLIKNNPKILVGFSDASALLNAIWKKIKLVTFHGPMMESDMSKLSRLSEFFFLKPCPILIFAHHPSCHTSPMFLS